MPPKEHSGVQWTRGLCFQSGHKNRNKIPFQQTALLHLLIRLPGAWTRWQTSGILYDWVQVNLHRLCAHKTENACKQKLVKAWIRYTTYIFVTLKKLNSGLLSHIYACLFVCVEISILFLYCFHCWTFMLPFTQNFSSLKIMSSLRNV